MGLISGSLIRELRSHRLYGSAKNASKTKKNIAYTAVFKMDNQQVLLYSTENSAQCHVAAWMGGEFRGEWIYVSVWLSPFPVHQKLSQYCLLAIFQYKMKSLKKFFK